MPDDVSQIPAPPSEPPSRSYPAPPAANRKSSPLAFGSRPLALAIGLVLLATMVTAGVLGYRDHRNTSVTRTVGTTAPTSTPATTAPVQTKPPTKCKKASKIPKAAGKPTDIPVPDKPVTALRVRDLKVGRGKAVQSDEQLTLQYVGVSCASGEQFDSSWDSNQPYSVRLDRGTVIPGWDQGIKGMKAGGRRLLWIPASLAFGDAGRPPDIAPGDTVIFVIDLVKIA